jgi:coenzyme PQQ precursor peptide PqqA
LPSNEITVVLKHTITYYSSTAKAELNKENRMWTKPQAQDTRFGFEVTMYIAAR